MENSAEALKFAFAIFLFVMALSIAFMVLSQAKSTGDAVMFYSDKTNFQQNYDVTGQNQIVGVDDLITTLYRYYKESISVTIKDKNSQIIAIFDTSIEGNCPWRHSNADTKVRIEEFVTGRGDYYSQYNNYITNSNNYVVSTNGKNQLKSISYLGNYIYPSAAMSLEDLCNNNLKDARFNKRFVEATVGGEYKTPDDYTLDGTHPLSDDGTTIQITPGSKKVYIEYQLIN